MITLSTHGAIRDIPREDWDALAGPAAPPFVAWTFLDALEATGCVRPGAGWAPLHLALREGDRLLAVAPAYVKGNSDGEFIFDQAWARFAYERLGVAYYPKLVVGVPFTPATGPRLLIAEGEDRPQVVDAFARGLRRVTDELRLSSAHVLFPSREEAEALGRAGMAVRLGVQYHWRNEGYRTFDDFLERFGSKRRNQIRRERRELTRQGTRVETRLGGDITPEAVDAVYEFYRSTVDKYYWGRRYLNRDFFHDVCARMPHGVHLALARDDESGRLLGGAFNLVGGGALYGRYWGAVEERPFLHFNVCYYAGIEHCIARGLSVFEPGAGGEHKLTRGFEPTLTYSAHHLSDPRLDSIIRDFLARERAAVEAHRQEYGRRPVLRCPR